jgi:Bacterial PH domain
VSRPARLRFRMPGAILVAAMIAFVGTLPIAGRAWYLAPVLLVPVLLGAWAWRSGTDVDAAGLHVRALIGQRDISWSRVAELSADPRGRAAALLTDGRVIRLTAVSGKDLPQVIAAGGQESTTD